MKDMNAFSLKHLIKLGKYVIIKHFLEKDVIIKHERGLHENVRDR
jgi:hypothetical protein